MIDSAQAKTSEDLIALEDQFGAHNYRPLDVVVERAEGAWVYGVDGERYLDCLSAYSAVNQGHCNPRILAALKEQAGRVTLTSRAFRNDQLPLFCKDVTELCGLDVALPMNTGAEAVETAIKAARRWGYGIKGIPQDQAVILTFQNNFHGRTTTIIGFSTEPSSRKFFGPFTPGFETLPYGDIDAIERAMGPNVAAVLIEPIQCEAGIIIPPEGYLKQVEELCRRHHVLLILDEIQTGLGRTGKMLCAEHEGVRPDAFILGKALSGGFYPVSALVGTRELMSVFDPGSHGSTYGGNPLGCAVAREALAVLREEKLAERSAELGEWFVGELRKIEHPEIKAVRGKGLLAGVELTVPARRYCERLKELGLLCKETHDFVIRFAPPLVVTRGELEWAVGRIREAFQQ